VKKKVRDKDKGGMVPPCLLAKKEKRGDKTNNEKGKSCTFSYSRRKIKSSTLLFF
jgi:hypothetical protein